MTQQKMTILIDQDDVLAEYIEGVIEAYNKKYQTTFSSEDCNTWNLYSVFGEEVDTVMHEPELFRNLKPVKNAIEVFERLYRSNLFELYIVTAANPSCVEAKCDWLRKNLPFFPEDRFIVCKRKYMIKGDILLDDGMHNIEDFAAYGGTPVIFDRPHNQGEGSKYKRVEDWLTFEKWLMGLYAQQSDSLTEKNVI